ncbi:leucine-rich repeat-containing protein 34-like isoform X2 [Lineus longissimus]|uniref:leucine-rich repeat-containing protein 34-like isoform X2 n=1 Tax=Lineus longissimus TaxID=88925 RepID=UPI002B4C9BE4
MATVHELAEEYDRTCREYGCVPSTFIVAAFNKEKDETILELRENMNMRLRGNVHNLEHSKLTDHDVLMLCKTLESSENTYINRLDLKYNKITDEGATTLAEFLKKNEVIKEVNLMDNDIEEDGAVALAKVLHSNQTLLSLRMNGNKFGNKGGMAFAQALQINTTLLELDVGETDQKTESLIAFATALRENDTLKALGMDSPLLFSVQEETTDHFARMLKVNRGLVELHLQKSRVRDFGATRLSENLMENMTLQYLDLRCNRITRDGAKDLAKLLKMNGTLKVLDLGFNRIEDDGAIALAEALETSNMSLTTLGLQSNQIGEKGLCALANCMKINSSLTNIYVWGNQFEPKACEDFARLVNTMRLDPTATDIQPYVVDEVTYVSELSHGIRRNYFWEPCIGDSVPKDEEIDQRLVSFGVV